MGVGVGVGVGLSFPYLPTVPTLAYISVVVNVGFTSHHITARGLFFRVVLGFGFWVCGVNSRSGSQRGGAEGCGGKWRGVGEKRRLELEVV